MRRPYRIVLLLAAVIPVLTAAQTERPDDIPPSHGERTRTYDVKSYVLHLGVDYEQRSIAGDVTVTLNPLSDGLTQVALDSAELHINNVVVNGVSAQFQLNKNQILIPLSRPYKATEVIALKISYEGSPRKGLYWIGGDPAYPRTPKQVWSQGEDEDSHFWFP